MQNGANADTSVRQSREQKIECEIRRLQAETAKLNAETMRINNDSKVFSRQFIIKAVLATILIVPIVWFYFDQIFLPIMRKDNIELELKNAESLKRIDDAKRQLEEQKQAHQSKVNRLETQRKEVETKLAEIELARKELSDDHRELQEDYDDLAHQKAQSEVEKATLESRMIQLSSRLQAHEKRLTILAKFYEAYYKIKSEINIYIEPEFKYEAEKDASPTEERYIKLMPSLLKNVFQIGGSTQVTLMQKKEEFLGDEELKKLLSTEEQKGLTRKANYTIAGAVLRIRENSILARFEVTADTEDGRVKPVISFLHQIPIRAEPPMTVFNDYGLARDRILRFIFEAQLRAS